MKKRRKEGRRKGRKERRNERMEGMNKRKKATKISNV